MKRAVLIGTAALAMAAAPAFAQAQKQGATATRAKAGSDQMFVTKAAAGGLAEVELGKLAQDKGASEQV